MAKHLSPAWIPDANYIKQTNIYQALQHLQLADYPALHQFSVNHYETFWDYTIKQLKINFSTPYNKIADLTTGITRVNWLANSKLNIADSCFQADINKVAIIYQKENAAIETITYAELNKLANRIANSLITQGFKKGDAIAIYLPMHITAVAIYLGIIKAGCTVVSIASSFVAEEIAVRMNITAAKAIFTQDILTRNHKSLPLYEKVIAASNKKTIVINTLNKPIATRDQDLLWDDFLVLEENFSSIPCASSDPCNILFSSGTTAEPKAIIWTHTTPIKCAADAYYHQDVKSNDIIAWPSDLGWMMGPWLVFAGLINKATIALYEGSPTTREFGEFIANAKISILGLVPSIVATWHNTRCMEGLDWQSIKLFSSSGECSNPDDMLYLMSLAQNKPIIEYCGGTEIGGAYITSTVVQPNIPATFTTPALGLDFVMLNEQGTVTENGEVALIPPSIGLSNDLLNRDHEVVYYAGMPKTPEGKILRRHGDQIEKIDEYLYRALGRVDDTMNLGGIKTSSAEIERTLAEVPEIKETAAIAVNPKTGGPSLLVIYAVTNDAMPSTKIELQNKMQHEIKTNLNPLFKIHDIVIVTALPRTASNKIMRRVLRDEYQQT